MKGNNMKRVRARKGEYFVYTKRSGRFAVRSAAGKWVTGADKLKILQNEGLVKPQTPSKKKAAPAEEAPKAE